MKKVFIIMLLILIGSVLSVMTSLVADDIVTFAFSAALCILSTLGCIVAAGTLDDKKHNKW